MIQINRPQIDSLTKTINSKSIMGKDNSTIYPSYACVVLSETRYFILVVPCSSKKYGSGFPEIVDATPIDGFSCNTGIQTQSYRWVSKNRVISTLGQVSSTVLDSIDNKILQLIPTYSRFTIQSNNIITQLQSDLVTANETISTLKSEHDACSEELKLH